jgi:hypothetical protein
MRFRAGLVFVFLALWMGVGCRKPLAPTVDTDLAPETWITAAPQDTLTTRNPETGTVEPPTPGSIPFRYHLYWSGSDHDGQVVGFYWAVVETVGSVAGLPIPPLPGPKPQDYHYTTKTDSFFIFNVLEETNNRQHAFYIYAVDDKGKPDPTPARVIFNTLDLYPPIPVIEADCVPNPTTGSRATGLIFHANEAWDGAGPFPTQRETTIALCDTFSRGTQPSDIVPMGSRVHIQWHSEIRVADNAAIAYKYKIGEGNEVEFVQVPASVTSTDYNTTDQNRLGPGLKVFTLRAIDQAGAARTSPETTRRFFMNYTPDTWFAGPDTSAFNYQTQRYANGQLKFRYYQVGVGTLPPNWSAPVTGSLLSPDSVNVMAAKRKPNKTFFEIYTEGTGSTATHRIYVHTEGDTVHMNSWVVLCSGGFDPDSPYGLRITIGNPNLPGIGTTPVLTSGPANGSPIGFHFRVPVRLDSIGPVSTFPESQIYPFSDPAFVAEPHISGYQGMQQSGRAYAITRSEDGNRGADRRIDDPVAFADSLERGLITPSSPRYQLKDKVLTFYVNRAPYLSLDDRNFHPSVIKKDTIFTRNFNLTLDKVQDDDPYQSIQRSVGGMKESIPLFRYSVTVRGRRTGSSPPRDTVWAPPELARKTGTNLNWPIVIPDFLSGPELLFDIEVCDCRDCEAIPGSGRCRRYPPIPVTMLVPGPQTGATNATFSPTGPGSSGESSRSRTP